MAQSPTSTPSEPPKTHPPSSSQLSTSQPAMPAGLDPSQSINIRSQTPLPLTASQEAEVRELYYKRVRAKCADEIREFATCCTNRTVSITWACRAQRQAMNNCMNAAAGREEEDRAREEWFRRIPDRVREKEEAHAALMEERRKFREWWGVDEQGRRAPGEHVKSVEQPGNSKEASENG